MKKLKIFIKKNIKFYIALLIGIIISCTYVYATTIQVESNNVKFNNTNSKLKKNNVSVSNVKDALDALYEKTEECGVFKPGDYVDMTPTKTSSSTISTLSGVTGSVTPSELSVWRVIRVNSNCTVEMVSEYVSTTSITLSGKEGYKNMVYGLNEYAKLYANANYTLDSETAPLGFFRNMGYDGQTLQIIDDTRLDDTILGSFSPKGAWYYMPTSSNGEESLGGGDQGFVTDVKLLTDAGISLVAFTYNTTSITDYWLASRLFNQPNNPYAWYFIGRCMSSAGSISGNELYYYQSNQYNNSTCSRAIRPIVTLKSGITPVSGNGTSSSHYQLG